MSGAPVRHPVLLAWVPTARTLPVAGPASLAAAAIGLMAVTFLDRDPGEPAVPMVVRVALLLAASMVAWAFDDPAAAMVAPTPLGRVRLRMIRALTIMLPWVVVLGVVAVLSGEPHGPQRYLVEGAGMMLWMLGLAAAAARVGSAEPGRVAMGILVPLVGVALPLVPQRILWGEPVMVGQPARWWLGLLVMGSVASLIAVAGPDPLRSRAGQREHRRTSASDHLDVAAAHGPPTSGGGPAGR